MPATRMYGGAAAIIDGLLWLCSVYIGKLIQRVTIDQFVVQDSGTNTKSFYQCSLIRLVVVVVVVLKRGLINRFNVVISGECEGNYKR